MDTERKSVCCFTGHRSISCETNFVTSQKIKHAVNHLIRKGVRTFIVGGALGFDTIAAVTVINMRDNDPLFDENGERVDISLHVAVPCKGQSDKWSFGDRTLYNSILSSADSVTVLSDTYTRDCMFARNRYMVDRSAYCVCFVTHRRGGSYYTMNYAKRSGLEIINLAPPEEAVL